MVECKRTEAEDVSFQSPVTPLSAPQMVTNPPPPHWSYMYDTCNTMVEETSNLEIHNYFLLTSQKNCQEL